MKIEGILTNRRGCRDYYWQIVYEWEDCLSQSINVPIVHNILVNRWISCPWNRIFGTLANMPTPKHLLLAFVMRPFFLDDNIAGKSNIIPAIIDFWARDDADIDRFEQRYRNNPAVLISSRQVYDLLKKKGIEVNIYHWPLSLPDTYRLRPQEKKYDCILVGRPSNVLIKWMMQYYKEHDDFTYVFNDRDRARGMSNYITSTGRSIGDRFNSRAAYFELLRMSRVGLYSTPSIDGDKLRFNKQDSNGYDQVTPRLFEYVAAGCHVIARYPKNSDTEYFNLSAVAHHVTTYEEFRHEMDYARVNPVDSLIYTEWLSSIYTSNRACMLMDIMDSVK